MADPQTTDTHTSGPQTSGASSDKGRSRTAPEAQGGGSAVAAKGEAPWFAGEGARPAQAIPEGAAMVRDLSMSAAEATRAVSQHGRETARDVAESWRDVSASLLSMHLDMNRWLQDFWQQTTGLGAFTALRPAGPFASFAAAPLLGLPPVDLKETKDAYSLCVELPGLSREEVDLEIRGDTLRLSGQKAEEKDDHGAAYRVSERRFGRFERRFPLPPGVDRSKIEAGFRDGLLKVTLPKTGAAATPGERIEIRN
jgi:HSP20 family protein